MLKNRVFRIERLTTGDIVAIPVMPTLFNRAKEQKIQHNPDLLELCYEDRVHERVKYWKEILNNERC
jgi:hypothetical protein